MHYIGYVFFGLLSGLSLGAAIFCFGNGQVEALYTLHGMLGALGLTALFLIGMVAMMLWRLAS